MWHTTGTSDLAEFNNLVNFGRAKATGRGLVSNVGEAGAFFHSRGGLPAPDLQVHMAPTGFWDNGLHEATTRKVTVAPTLVSVASRGQLRLRSTDPRWHPDIDPAYYDDQADLDAMVAGVQRVVETVASGAVARYVDRPFLPAGRAPSEAEIVEHLRQNTQTLYHPVGTCAMGRGAGRGRPELRVRGVEGLRVADASVMPVVPRGNTNAPTVMIGEKAADLVRGRARRRGPMSQKLESTNPATGDLVGVVVDEVRRRRRGGPGQEAAGWWAEQGFAGRAGARPVARRAHPADGPARRRRAPGDRQAARGRDARDRDGRGPPGLGRGPRREGARGAEGLLGLLMANQAASVEYLPLGVVGVIGPWNYPVFTPMGSIGYALAAGNTVVFKPSELTPGVGVWLADSLAEVVPDHPLLQVVVGFGRPGPPCAARASTSSRSPGPPRPARR